MAGRTHREPVPRHTGLGRHFQDGLDIGPPAALPAIEKLTRMGDGTAQRGVGRVAGTEFLMQLSLMDLEHFRIGRRKCGRLVEVAEVAQAVTYVPPGGGGWLYPVFLAEIDKKRVKCIVFLRQIPAQLFYGRHPLSIHQRSRQSSHIRSFRPPPGAPIPSRRWTLDLHGWAPRSRTEPRCGTTTHKPCKAWRMLGTYQQVKAFC